MTLGNTTYNIYLQSGTTTINGKITCTKGPALRTLGTAILLGNLITTGNGRIADLGSGELTWVGDRTVAAGEMLNLGMQTAGTWKFATATDALTLTNSGKFSFVYAAGTCTLTAAGGTAEIINQTASAGTAILGQAVTVTGPVIPDEEDVLKPADGGPATYGYSGDPQTGTAVAATGVARGSATLAKETGANARGGSGTCAKLSPTSVSLWGYWEFFVKVPAGEFKLSFYYKSFHTTAAWNGTLKVSLWDSDDPDESPPPLLDNVDVAGTYDATYRLWESAAKTAAAEGLCRVRIAILNGSDSGGVYLDDLAVTAT